MNKKEMLNAHPIEFVRNNSELILSQQIVHPIHGGIIEFRKSRNDRVFILTIRDNKMDFGIWYLPILPDLSPTNAIIHFMDYAEIKITE